jgi:drug/metabolite transporter (DMT)-like permease
LGYAAAVGCALIWSGYSVLNRRLVADVPSDAATGFCLATAVLALLAHALLEPAGWPQGGAWLAVLALGLGPVGAAFFLWDLGTKRGALQVLGAAAYLAPLLGTLLLLFMGRGEPSLGLLAATALIIGGAVIASRAGARPAEAQADAAALSRMPSQ